MTNKTEWQEANRRLMAEQREKLGDPPTAEEMLAYSRGEMSAEEEDRIRDLLVAYPELARMYGEPFPEEPEADVSNEASPEAIRDGWNDVQRRLGVTVMPARARMRNYIPTTIAAALALVFFGLYVQAESRARDHARGCDLPRVLGAPQELNPGGSRSGAATPLRKDGDAYLLKPQLLNQLHYPYYSIELHDASGAVWTSSSAQPDHKGTFQIVIPHDFLRPGVRYQLRIFGIDGDTPRPVGSYDVMVPSE
jgi:hypothetical protein